MKYVSHVLLPPILICLIAAAIYGPRYYLNPPEAEVATAAVEQAATEEVTIEPFLEKLEANQLSEAKSLIDDAPDSMKTGLRVALISAGKLQSEIKAAEDRERDLQQRISVMEDSIAEAKAEIAKLSKVNLAYKTELETSRKIQEVEVAKIQNAISDLMGVAKNSKNEISELKEFVENAAIPGTSDALQSLFPPVELPKSIDPLVLPAPMTVDFKNDSTAVPDSVRIYVNYMGKWLADDERLAIRLLSRFQNGYSIEQNDTLVEARLNSIEEILIRNGAVPEQIELVPYEAPSVPEPAEDEPEEAIEPEKDEFGFIELEFFARK